MSYSLWCNGVLLGHTSPAALDHATREIGGFFHPTDAFETVGAPLAAWANEILTMGPALAAELPSQESMEGLTPEERGWRVHHAMRGSARVQRLLALERGVADLGLELRDERGRTVRAEEIKVVRVPVPDDTSDAIRDSVVQSGVEFSDYVLLARPAPTKSA